MNDKNSLAHTKWNCKYHIVFAPKYRRKLIYGELKVEISKIIRELCKWKEVTIVEAELYPDHIHMLVEIPPKMSVSGFVGFLKGKSSLIIHERHGNLKYKLPVQYRIINKAFRDLRRKLPEYGRSDDKASVVEQIRSARQASRKQGEAEPPKHKKDKAGSER